MQHGLSVQTDQRHAASIDGEFGQEGFNRADMSVGDGGLQLGERATRRLGIGDDVAQARGDLGRIGIGRARAGLDLFAPVGAQ